MHERTVVLCCLAVLLVLNQWDSLFVLFLLRTPKGKRGETGIGTLKERNLYLFRFNSFWGHGSKSWGAAGKRAVRAQFPYLQHFADLPGVSGKNAFSPYASNIRDSRNLPGDLMGSCLVATWLSAFGAVALAHKHSLPEVMPAWGFERTSW